MPVRAPASRFFKWTLATSFVGSWDYYKMKEFYDSLESVLQKHRELRPPAAGEGFFFTHWWFTISDLQANLATSALESMVLATAITLLVLLLATQSLQATIIATVAIAGVLCCTMGVLVFLGWEMGIIESMCLAILIGISCDFVVHLAWAYVTADNVVELLARTPPDILILQAPTEKELKRRLETLRTQFELPASKLSYDSTKSFADNQVYAAKVARAVSSEPSSLKAETKRQVQRARFARTQFALGTMGISVSSAAATTLVAAICLSQGIIEFFHAFGLFLIFTICFALLFAIVFFAAGAMMCGPTRYGSNKRCKTVLNKQQLPDAHATSREATSVTTALRNETRTTDM
jgi:predicted RND superfamily exporter protein